MEVIVSPARKGIKQGNVWNMYALHILDVQKTCYALQGIVLIVKQIVNLVTSAAAMEMSFVFQESWWRNAEGIAVLGPINVLVGFAKTSVT